MAKPQTPAEPLIKLEVASDLSITLGFSSIAVIIILAGIAGLILFLFLRWMWFVRAIEFDSAEFGFGRSKIKFKPNAHDRQIAYAIWVELSTRKIGLEIDLDHDVVSEIYDSWYSFFGVTRELIKDVPAHKLKQAGTRSIVESSIQVLNNGLRPHLTTWQARFRHWLEKQAKGTDDPQMVQTQFPKFDDLKVDLMAINKKLIAYRKKMYQLATGDKEIDIENN